jgi:hypothetical protein
VSPRARALAPWAVVAAVITGLLCAAAWPRATGWAVGLVVGTVALALGVRQLARELRHVPAEYPLAQCAGCAGCGGPDCVENPVLDELTAEEARALAEDLGFQLYKAQDALAYVAEMCDIADEHRGKRGEPATVTTARVREWLRGAQCARQTGLILPAGWLRARADQMEQQ